MDSESNIPGPQRCPALRPDLAVIPMADGVQLRAGDEEIYFIRCQSPSMVTSILRSLSGGNSIEAIRAQAGTKANGIVDSVLRELQGQGLLTIEAAPANEIEAYLSHFRAAGAPGTGEVAIVGHCATAELLASVLSEHGLIARPSRADTEFPATVQAAICVWEAPDLAFAEQVNAVVCQRQIPCLFVDMSHGQHATIGPFYLPGEGACFRCLRQRLRENTAAYAELVAAEEHMRESGRPLPAYGMLPAFRYQVAGVAAAELVAFFTRHRPLRTLNRITTVDYERLRMWDEPAWRIPWCSACRSER